MIVVLVARMADSHDMDKAASKGLRIEFKTSIIKDIIKLFFGDKVALTLKPASDARLLQFIFEL